MKQINKGRPLTSSEKRARYLARDPERRKRIAENARKWRAAKRANSSESELLAEREKKRLARHRRAGAPVRIVANRAEAEARRTALYEIVAHMHPMTVRQVFYQATVRGVIEKTESGYKKVQHELTKMRRSGELPYGWLTDNTRWQRKPRTFDSVKEALEETARFYRKNLWADLDAHVEIWLEKDALSGVVYPITSEYDVPLMVTRGYASLSFLYESAEYINALAVPTYIYHFGDFDPSGVDAANKIETTLTEMCPDQYIDFQRVAVTQDQIDLYNLPTRPKKEKDTRSRNFQFDGSVELDAFEPETLRELVRECIESHLPRRRLEALIAAEESERNIFMKLANQMGRQL